MVFGTDISVAVRPTTPGTFETSTGLTCEVYWPAPVGLDAVPQNWQDLRWQLFQNLLQAAQQVDTLQHLIFVDDAKDTEIQQAVHATGIPYTCLGPTAVQIQQAPTAYRAADMGVLGQGLMAEPLREQQQVASSPTIFREDLSALTVQALLTVDWKESRCLAVTDVGSDQGRPWQEQSRDGNNEWCPNGHLLQQALEMETNSYAYY